MSTMNGTGAHKTLQEHADGDVSYNANMLRICGAIAFFFLAGAIIMGDLVHNEGQSMITALGVVVLLLKQSASWLWHAFTN